MRITVAQLNPVVGDLAGNYSRLEQTFSAARKDGADLVVFSELFIVGYPPKDLLDFEWFIKKSGETAKAVVELTRKSPGLGILFGAPLKREGDENGLYNSAVLACDGEVLLEQHKSLLPTYDVFDEARYFDPAGEIPVVRFKGEVLGISICEDAWTDSEIGQVKKKYRHDPIAELAKKGSTLFINISASPFNVGKEIVRYDLICSHAKRHGIPFLYVNQIGANDELIFDGRSIFVDGNGDPVRIFPAFKEAVGIVDTNERGPARVPGRDGHPGGIPAKGGSPLYVPQEEIESVYEALLLGVRDYMRKCGFSKSVVGLSGGIDSAVTVCVAAAAAGRENVIGINMPSPFSSKGSIDDSRELAERLGIQFMVVPIDAVYASYLETLRGPFEGRAPDVTEENIQARIRGNILMGFSNKFGCLLLSTGNKSELSTGYCTLYGDMSGGLAVIADVPKTMVYDLAEYINRHGPIIPKATIEKAPSAELRPNQTDQDTLPPYPLLDEILSLHIEKGLSAEEIVSKGLDLETVRWVVRTVARNEYKRKQAAPGLRVTSKAFGIGRRMPLAARYWE
jgi:NAD+ synthase (glutamine-hydrolysing)